MGAETSVRDLLGRMVASVGETVKKYRLNVVRDILEDRRNQTGIKEDCDIKKPRESAKKPDCIVIG